MKILCFLLKRRYISGRETFLRHILPVFARLGAVPVRQAVLSAFRRARGTSESQCTGRLPGFVGAHLVRNGKRSVLLRRGYAHRAERGRSVAAFVRREGRRMVPVGGKPLPIPCAANRAASGTARRGRRFLPGGWRPARGQRTSRFVLECRKPILVPASSSALRQCARNMCGQARKNLVHLPAGIGSLPPPYRKTLIPSSVR